MAHPLLKGVGILALTALAAPRASSQEVAVKVQNYTSSISTSTLNHQTVSQQTGSPLGFPVKIMGDDVLSGLGLFGALTELCKSSSGVDEIVYTKHDGIQLYFDGTINALTINASVDAGTLRVAVIDTAGSMVLMETFDEAECTLDLTHLTPGIYIAAATTSNNFYKSIKFTVK